MSEDLDENKIFFINNNERKIRETFSNILADGKLKRIDIVSAFFGFDGFIKNFIIDCVKSGIKINLIVGNKPYHIPPKEAKDLQEFQKVNSSLITVQQYKKSDINPTFHSKFYLFYTNNDSPSLFLMGSSNMTDAGFSTTYESNLLGNEKTILSLLKDEYDKIPVTNFDSSIYSETAKISYEQDTFKPLLSPFRYQSKIVDTIVTKFTAQDKGKMILPCGTGKTLISLWIKEKINAKKVVVFLPNLALVKQTMDVWNKQKSQDYKVLCVCSDQSVGLSDDETSGKVEELKKLDKTIQITTNPESIKKFIQSNDSFVIFSTYHSSKKIVEAIGTKKIFDCVFYDESHNIAQLVSPRKKKSEEFMTQSHQLESKKKLFMTATPKIITSDLMEKAEDYRMYSMDDPAIFGETFYEMSFREAIEDPEIPLVDYKILLIDQTKEFKAKGSVESKDIAQAALLKVYAAKYQPEEPKIDIKRIISYHSNISLAKGFIDPKSNFESIKQQILGTKKLFASHINGSMKAVKRVGIIQEFQKSDNGLITNVRCLTEGIDVPQIDAVFFSDPKTSIIDIIQAIGRALRRDIKNPNKIAYVIVPIYNGLGGYKSLIHVLNALKHVDEPLNALINKIHQANINNTDASNDLKEFTDRYLAFLPTDKLSAGEIKSIQDSIKLEITDSLLNFSHVVSKYTGKETGFWKRCTKFDVSETSSPGQFIIPLEYVKVFPPLQEETVERGKQAAAVFNITFVDESGKSENVDGVRILKYIPASTHKRQNVDGRFTFKNSRYWVRKNIKEGDILVFEKNDMKDRPLKITLIKKDASQAKKFPYNTGHPYGWVSI